jgi:hypothetical protein
MKMMKVCSETSVILHKKERPKYLGSNVNTIPTAHVLLFVYCIILAASADRTATKISSPGKNVLCTYDMCLGGWQRRYGHI